MWKHILTRRAYIKGHRAVYNLSPNTRYKFKVLQLWSAMKHMIPHIIICTALKYLYEIYLLRKIYGNVTNTNRSYPSGAIGQLPYRSLMETEIMSYWFADRGKYCANVITQIQRCFSFWLLYFPPFFHPFFWSGWLFLQSLKLSYDKNILKMQIFMLIFSFALKKSWVLISVSKTVTTECDAGQMSTCIVLQRQFRATICDVFIQSTFISLIQWFAR